MTYLCLILNTLLKNINRLFRVKYTKNLKCSIIILYNNDTVLYCNNLRKGIMIALWINTRFHGFLVDFATT